MLHILILGGTSAIAEQCARLWSKQSAKLVLIGRNQERLSMVAADLRVRSPSSEISIMVSDQHDAGDVVSLVDRCFEQLGRIDIALVAQGWLPDQEECQDNISMSAAAINVNALMPALFCEALAKRMQHLAPATIAVIGSVAGDRGRKSNYVYGAAKNLLATYIEGMQHRFAKTGLHILLIKPGPTSTPMTAHLKASGAALAEPDEVAADILNAVRKKSRVLYTPGKWQVIMFVIRCLPFAIFKHLNI